MDEVALRLLLVGRRKSELCFGPFGLRDVVRCHQAYAKYSGVAQIVSVLFICLSLLIFGF